MSEVSAPQSAACPAENLHRHDEWYHLEVHCLVLLDMTVRELPCSIHARELASAQGRCESGCRSRCAKQRSLPAALASSKPIVDVVSASPACIHSFTSVSTRSSWAGLRAAGALKSKRSRSVATWEPCWLTSLPSTCLQEPYCQTLRSHWEILKYKHAQALQNHIANPSGCSLPVCQDHPQAQNFCMTHAVLQGTSLHLSFQHLLGSQGLRCTQHTFAFLMGWCNRMYEQQPQDTL